MSGISDYLSEINFIDPRKPEKLEFIVSGSTGNKYHCSVTKKGNNLTAICDCPGGKNHKYCKHLFSILAGSSDRIIDGDINDLKKITDWLAGTDVESALKAVILAEEKLKKATDHLQKCKNDLAKAMKN